MDKDPAALEAERQAAERPAEAAAQIAAQEDHLSAIEREHADPNRDGWHAYDTADRPNSTGRDQQIGDFADASY